MKKDHCVVFLYCNVLLSIISLYCRQTLIFQILLPWKKWFAQESASLAAMLEGRKDTFLFFNKVYYLFYLLLVISAEIGLGEGLKRAEGRELIVLGKGEK